MKKIILFNIFFCLYHKLYGYVEKSVIISTSTGRIRGRRIQVPGMKMVDEFLGIPYAKAPIGNLRFKKPFPVTPWSFIYNATQQSNSCPQAIDTLFKNFSGSEVWNPNTKLSEDCLYINIWLPYPSQKNAAILVWIFGGGFFSGTITLPLYNGKILASQENVIVASINYRFGSLGFLYTGTEEAPGNQGLYDQLLGLKWIRENARAFGGNPNRITLFGESAGAASISFHLISPLSTPFFNNAILESSGPTSPWALTTTDVAKQRAVKFGKAFKCPVDDELSDPSALIECLKKQSIEDIIPREYFTTEPMNYPFVPVIDGEFIRSHPQELLELGLFKRTPILLGSNANEGFYFSIYSFTDLFVPLNEIVNLTPEDLRNGIKEVYFRENEISHEAILFQYTMWSNYHDPNEIMRSFDKMAGDYWFTCPVNKFASYYAHAGLPVYMYHFTHRSSVHAWPQWSGVLHADEINFIFGEPLLEDSMYTPEERHFSMRIMNYWANFAKYNNPNLNFPRKKNDILWPVYTHYGKEFLELNANMSMNNYHIGRGPRIEYCAFQNNYLPQLTKQINVINEKATFCSKSHSTSIRFSKVLSVLFLLFALDFH